jgi:hypothetical protein
MHFPAASGKKKGPALPPGLKGTVRPGTEETTFQVRRALAGPTPCSDSGRFEKLTTD